MCRPAYSNCSTLLVTEMPRWRSISIQSLVTARLPLLPLTVPAMWTAPPYSSSFSVIVVLPASGCEMIANVRRFATLALMSLGGAIASDQDDARALHRLAQL